MEPGLLTALPDSARVVGDVYAVSLLATVPILAALVASVLLRRSSAGVRATAWRCAIVGVLAVAVGRLLPVHWMAWVLPEALTWPLVTLGRTQLESPGTSHVTGITVDILWRIYLAGMTLVLLPTLIARLRLARAVRGATSLDDARWQSRLRSAASRLGVRRDVRLVASPVASVPMTWGIVRPVIMLPAQASEWPAARVAAVLRHELSHVGAHDTALRLAARVACAVFWFHPGVWWLARRFEADAEAACDDRVLLSGVRASDYAEWLAASVPVRRFRGAVPAMSLVDQHGLRERLRTVTDTRRCLTTPGRAVIRAAVLATIVFMMPLSTMRLAPTRAALTSLMRDARWESRAWAVVRLAQRPDSVEVARAAARHDPDPAVRAWARYALTRGAAGHLLPPPRS